eukprot:GHRR01028826.1.p1 GENE.GHRR01028826.1~~GHRR01028826.1.p1  ORF type:complete len:250 (+),score=76.77 GHRR01028826.1:467-1216(+)
MSPCSSVSCGNLATSRITYTSQTWSAKCIYRTWQKQMQPKSRCSKCRSSKPTGIHCLQEFYGDFVALDVHHFMVPVPCNEVLINPRAAAAFGASEFEAVDRLVQGLSALFLALRRRPVIRYQRTSDAAKRLAEGLYTLTYKQQPGVFDFGSRSSPVVLLLDRTDDPLTPLLTQWTYQAMIHELIGIRDNRAVLTSSKVAEQYREVVVDPASDDFYKRHLYSNYGEVGLSVKELVDKFSTASAQHKQVDR